MQDGLRDGRLQWEYIVVRNTGATMSMEMEVNFTL